VNTDTTNGSSLNPFGEPSSGQSSTGVVAITESGATGADHHGSTANDEGSSIFGSQSGTDALEFRVSRASESWRRLRLTGNRYTFGNADGCTIRLNDPSLRPMHAVLIRDASGVLIRTYAVPVEVNGTETTEATLQEGDVLRLGIYEFELLGPSNRSHPSPAQQPSSISIAEPKIPSLSNLPPTDEVVWRERLRREVDQWRQRQEDCDRREGRLDQRESEMRGRESELWSRADKLQHREARIQSQETETFQLYDEFAQRQQELVRLRDESQSRQETLRNRELEFREQELEYRRRLADATRQLDHSKLQADAATQAVARMREQFDALNAQIEELSNEQKVIEAKENQQTSELNRIRDELEEAQQEAELNQEASEQRRAEAERRVAELTAEIDQLNSHEIGDPEQQQSELEESKRLVDQLREQVGELTQSVADATEESSQLRSDYQQSCEKVKQLEDLVSESQQRGDHDRGEWAVEAEQLRAEVDRLSSDLSEANRQLTEVRVANESLNERFNDVRQERDDARIERDSRPTTEAFQTLREDLDVANNQLTEMKCQYDEMLAKLDETQSDFPESISADSVSAEPISDELSLIEPVADAMGLTSTIDLTADHPDANLSEDVVALSRSDEHDDDDDDAWPTYQSSTGDAIGEPADDTPLVAETEESSTDSPWANLNDLEESLTTDDNFASMDPAIEKSTNLWQCESTDSDESEEPEVGNEVLSGHTWGNTEVLDNSSDGWSVTDADDSDSIVAGALASELIKDIESDRGLNDIDDVDSHDFLDVENEDSQEPSDGLSGEIEESPTSLMESFDTTTPVVEEADEETIAGDATEDDDSIEAYMNRLLRRVQGVDETSDATMPETISVSTSNSAPLSESTDQETEIEDTTVTLSEPIEVDAPLVPRSQPPERSGNLSAMRDLANSSARNAISHSARVQSRDTQIQAAVSFGCAFGALACNIFAFYFLKGLMLMIAVAMTFVVAVCCLREGIHLLTESRRRVRPVDSGSESKSTVATKPTESLSN